MGDQRDVIDRWLMRPQYDNHQFLGLSESFNKMSLGSERVDRDKTCFNGGDIIRSPWMGLGLGLGLGVKYNSCGSRDSLGSPLTQTTRSSVNSSPTFVNGCSGEFQGQNLIGGSYSNSNNNKDVSDVSLWSHSHNPNEQCFNTWNGNDHHHRTRVNSNIVNNPRSVLGNNQSVFEYGGFNCEDSFILEMSPKRCVVDSQYEWRRGLVDADSNGLTDIGHLQSVILQNFRAMAARKGFVYLMAKDQSGCRNLQRVFDLGTREDVNTIFENVIDHVVELSTDPFGNYLVQKLLEVCAEAQRRQIVFVMTREPGDLLRISLNTHGTRVVQKLVETARNQRSILWLITALEPGILDLIKDLNGNHVLQSCLKCLSTEANAFIYNAATTYCVEVSTHRHGCCVMQKCIERSTGYCQIGLVTEILQHAVQLAADPYGNYVIQFIIDQKIPFAIDQMTAHFKGHYVFLSTQKCGSHVVEKCLKDLPETREEIIAELLTVTNFEQFLQDPYANYVIQSALKFSKGNSYHALQHRVRLHNHLLRASPFCKKILSQTTPKK